MRFQTALLLILLLALEACNMSKFYAHKRIGGGQAEEMAAYKQQVVQEEISEEVFPNENAVMPLDNDAPETDSPQTLKPFIITPDSGHVVNLAPLPSGYRGTAFRDQQREVTPIWGEPTRNGPSGIWEVVLMLLAILIALAFLAFFIGFMTFLIAVTWQTIQTALHLGFIVFLCSFAGLGVFLILMGLFSNGKPDEYWP